MRIRTAGLVSILVVASSGICRAAMRAGVARVDITPPAGEQMWGYENRRQPATGTLDPLYARVLVLEAGGGNATTRLALVTLDLGRSFGPASLATLRAEAKRTSAIDCLLVAASHTHSAPVVKDEYRNAPPAWEQAALDKIGQSHRGSGADARAGAHRRGDGRGLYRTQPPARELPMDR